MPRSRGPVVIVPAELPAADAGGGRQVWTNAAAHLSATGQDASAGERVRVRGEGPKLWEVTGASDGLLLSRKEGRVTSTRYLPRASVEVLREPPDDDGEV